MNFFKISLCVWGRKTGKESVVVSELLLSISCYIILTICTPFVFIAHFQLFLVFSDTLRAGLVCRLWITWIWSYTRVYRDCELGSYLTPGATQRQAERKWNTTLRPKPLSFSYLVLFASAFHSFPPPQIFLFLAHCNTVRLFCTGLDCTGMCCYVLLQDNHEEQPANNPDSCLLQERASALHVSRHHHRATWSNA